MRIPIVLFLSLVVHAAFAQTGSPHTGVVHPKWGNPDSVKVREMVRVAMVAAIQSGVGISEGLADSVHAVFVDYGRKRHAVIFSRIPREQKEQQIKRLAAERDERIGRLLTADQVVKLNAVFSKNKQTSHGKK